MSRSKASRGSSLVLECNEFNDILGQHNIVRNHAGTTHAEILLKEHTDEKIETASI